MHIVVIFESIGNYHAARLQAVYEACQAIGWTLTAIQVTNRTKEHPWGDVTQKNRFLLETLLPVSDPTHTTSVCANSSEAAVLLPACLKRIKPDVLAIPGWGFRISRAALHWSKQRRVPSVLMSDSKWDDARRFWLTEALKSWLYVRRYDAALVAGKLHRDYLVQLGFPSDRIFLGYDVVDNDYFAQCADAARQTPTLVRERQSQIPQKPYFIAVTRFIQRKNVPRLVDAYAAYHQQVGQDASWDLVICGSGADETTIRQSIHEHHLDECVYLPGFVTYQDIGDWYGLAYAFVHPALQEQWGLVVNEACAAGLPILCSRTVGACPEVVCDRQNGFTFDPTDTQDITRALLEMHHLDDNTRYKFGQFSRNVITTNYSLSSFACGLIDAVKTSLIKP